LAGGVAEEVDYGNDSYHDQESFRPTERVQFHETNDAPPDLRKLGKELERRAKARKEFTAGGVKSGSGSSSHVEEDPEAKKRRLEKVRLEAVAAYKELKKKRKV